MAVPAHQCPRCELRFATEYELKGHLSDDHGVGHLTHIFARDLHSPPRL